MIVKLQFSVKRYFRFHQSNGLEIVDSVSKHHLPVDCHLMVVFSYSPICIDSLSVVYQLCLFFLLLYSICRLSLSVVAFGTVFAISMINPKASCHRCSESSVSFHNFLNCNGILTFC